MERKLGAATPGTMRVIEQDQMCIYRYFLIRILIVALI